MKKDIDGEINLCDCGHRISDCLFFTIYQCVSGRHASVYDWKKPFPIKIEDFTE